jgi:hypothetical protein
MTMLYPDTDIKNILERCAFPVHPEDIEQAAPYIAHQLADLPFRVCFAVIAYGCGMVAAGLIVRGMTEKEAIAHSDRLKRAIVAELTRRAEEALEENVVRVH